MKTITQLSGACKSLSGMPFSLSVYTFSATNSKVFFVLEFSKRHIQPLIEMGVRFDFRKPFDKSDRSNGNDFITTVSCSVETMVLLDRFVRDNHLKKVSMLNDNQLLRAGFPLKVKKIFEVENPVLTAHLERIDEIRKAVRRLIHSKKKAPLVNYLVFCATKKLNY